MTEDKYGLSRASSWADSARSGVTSAGVGLGTTAYFSDDEMLGNNSLASGELDLLLDYKTTYHGGPGRLEDIREMGYDDATELEGEAGTYLLEEVPDTGDIDEWTSTS